MKVKSLSHVQLLATPWTAAQQAPPPMGFSRQEYWSGVPLPNPNVCVLKSQTLEGKKKKSLSYRIWPFSPKNVLGCPLKGYIQRTFNSLQK